MSSRHGFTSGTRAPRRNWRTSKWNRCRSGAWHFHRRGSTVAVGDLDGSVRWFNVAERRFRRCTGPSRGIESVAFSSDGHLLATVSREPSDATVKIWDAETRKEINRLPEPSAIVMRAVAFSPDDRWLAVGGRARQVKLWHLASSRVISLTNQQAEVWCVAFSADGRFLASGDAGRTIMRTFNGTRSCRSSRGTTHRSTRWRSPRMDGRWPRAAKTAPSSFGTWRWKLVGTLRAHASQINQLAFSPDGSVLATASSDGTVRLQRLEHSRRSKRKRAVGDEQEATEKTEPVIGSAQRDHRTGEWLAHPNSLSVHRITVLPPGLWVIQGQPLNIKSCYSGSPGLFSGLFRVSP